MSALSAAILVVVACALIVAFTVYALISTRRKRETRRKSEPGARVHVPKIDQPLTELIPDSKYVEIEGAKFHYVQAGEGGDVVLLHGIGASVFIWRFLFPILQTRHRVTALDLPGFGKSSKEPGRSYGLDAQTELVAQLLETIGIKNPILVGSSMGGAIALWLAKRHPERFGRIVALAPATDSRLVPSSAQLFTVAAPLLRRALNRRSMKLILQRVVTRQTLINDAVVDAYLAPFMDEGEGLRAFWSALSLLADARLPEGLRGLAARVLVIYGERDLLVPRRSIDRLLSVVATGQLVTHPDGGHHIMEDEPEWTARLIEEFSARRS